MPLAPVGQRQVFHDIANGDLQTLEIVTEIESKKVARRSDFYQMQKRDLRERPARADDDYSHFVRTSHDLDERFVFSAILQRPSRQLDNRAPGVRIYLTQFVQCAFRQRQRDRSARLGKFRGPAAASLSLFLLVHKVALCTEALTVNRQCVISNKDFKADAAI